MVVVVVVVVAVLPRVGLLNHYRGTQKTDLLFIFNSNVRPFYLLNNYWYQFTGSCVHYHPKVWVNLTHSN